MTRNLTLKCVALAVLGLASMATSPALAQISLTFENPDYFEDFNRAWTTDSTAWVPLTWEDNVTIPGFYIYRFATGSPETVLARQSSLSSPTTGEIKFASHSSFPDDFMLGSRPGDTHAGSPSTVGSGNYYAVRLVNDSDVAITSFSVAYDAFQWYRGTPEGNQLVVTYQVAPSNSVPDIISGDWTEIPDLFWQASITGSASTVNFHTTSSRVNFEPVLIGDVEVQPGEEIWVRWYLNNVGGVDQGVGIDNIAIVTSIPEPAHLTALGALAGLGFVLLRRRRKS